MSYYFPFNENVRRTQDFGAIQNNAVVSGGPHGGDDYGVPVGTPVRAAGDGVIDYAQEFDASYADNFAWNTSMAGLLVWLNCGDNAPSFEYGHLSRSLVVPGQRVKAGQVIALSGNSGGSTGPHCHVGCLPPGYDLNTPTYGRVNPRIYMTKYWSGEEKAVDDMSEITQENLRQIYDAVWFGVPGAKLIPNEMSGRGEWPYTTLGSLTARISRDIVRPNLTAGQVADAVIAEMGSDLAQTVVNEISKRLSK